MSAELSMWDLFANASLLVKGVMLLLLAASVLSWTFIIQRGWVLQRAQEIARQFETRFWSGVDLQSIYHALSSKRQVLEGHEHIFHAGFKEFLRLNKQGTGGSTLEGAQRAMRVAHAREVDGLESHLSFLATVGSISPYIGLFGTVWGIMHAFLALGAVKQATLAMVAPGIAEALVATAMGLFAAIPAVIAYNRYAHQVERLSGQYHTFLEEFSSLLHRQAHYTHATHQEV